jgi:hypothetical protein
MTVDEGPLAKAAIHVTYLLDEAFGAGFNLADDRDRDRAVEALLVWEILTGTDADEARRIAYRTIRPFPDRPLPRRAS